MAIISTSEFKTYKGISATTWDAQLNVIIPAAQRKVELWTGRKFDTATFTEYYDGTGSNRLFLNNHPIASITSIQYVDAAQTVQHTVDSSSYSFNPTTGEVRLEGDDITARLVDDWGTTYGVSELDAEFTRGFRNYKVIYVGGYGSSPAAETMDLALKQAMYEYVEVLLANATQTFGSSQYDSEALGDYNYKRKTPADIDAMFQGRFSMFRLGSFIP